jgi:hypothetical protein
MASDVNVLMLTPLKEKGHNFKVATQPGSWVLSGSSLSELGKALDVDKDAKVDLVRSTPDPWAQVRSFADVLLDPTTDDPRVIGQWRALLTILALSAQRESAYRVTFEAVPLFEQNSRFAQVMMHLLPQVSLPFPQMPDGTSCGWDRPVVMRVAMLDRDGRELPGARPLALFNPACLIAPGRDSDSWTCPVGWMKEGLIDPLTCQPNNLLPHADLNLLRQYLLRLTEELTTLCQGRGDAMAQTTLTNLLNRVRAFAADVARQPGMAGEGAEAFEFVVGEPLNRDLPAPYRLLATPIKAAPPKPGTSHCIIPLRADIEEQPFNGMVLLDRDLASDGRPATAITFWGHVTLQQALDMRASERKALADEITKAGFLLVTPDDFFTTVLLRVNEEDRPGQILTHPDRFKDHLLPLSPLILLVLSPPELAKRLDMARDGRVSLTIPLGAKGHSLSRTFAGGALASGIDWGLGDFAVWPDFKSARWQHYVARIEYGRGVVRRLRGRLAASGTLMARMLMSRQQPENRAEAASLWASSAPLDPPSLGTLLDRIPDYDGRALTSPDLTRLRARDTTSNVSEVQISRVPYEAAFFTVCLGVDQPPVPAGMALLAIRDVGSVSQADGEVSIDFGTTNTVACLNNENSPASLQARLVHPVQDSRETALPVGALGQALREFLPPDDRPLPTPTVIINRDLDNNAMTALKGNQVLNDALLLSQLIYFQPDFTADGTIASVGLGDWTMLLRRLRFNLKWALEKDMRDAARRYIRQLVLMLSAEWAADGNNPAQLRWHFSRPRNMGDDQEFVDLMSKAISEVIPDHRPDAVCKLVYEGDAAAAYILKDDTSRQSTKGRINVILDIGGGTTDFAIWSGGSEPRELASESIRLAGGDFFTGHITQNPALLEEFGLKPWAEIVEKLNRESDADIRENVRYVGELLFSGKTLEQAIDRNWSRVSGTERIRHLKETAFLFLGGVAWNVGWHLRQLINAGDLAEDDLKDIAVALCGRGSGLFARLHGNNPQAQTEISSILRLIAVGAGDAKPAHPQVQVSPHPKIEVAAGMIIMGRKSRGRAADTTKQTDSEGDDFSEATGSDSSSASAAPSQDPGIYTVGAPDIGEPDFERFLKGLGIASRFSITLTDFQRKKLKNRAAELYAADEATKRLPQEFADMLKAMVEMMRTAPDSNVKPATTWK